MKSLRSGVVALIAAIVLMVASPASADTQRPLRGHLELTNYSVPCAVEHVPPFLTWAGTVVIDGETYGWADFPIAPPVFDGKFLYAEEYWTIFTLDEGEVVDPTTACDAGAGTREYCRPEFYPYSCAYPVHNGCSSLTESRISPGDCWMR